MNEISVKIDQRVPEIICTDLDRFQQVLMNLLSNANKFTRKGKINIYCRMANNSDGWLSLLEVNLNFYSHLIVFIEDDGIGISKEDKKKLFKPFSRLKNGEYLNPNGHGLGLSNCKDIIEMLNGKIWIESSNQTFSC